MIQITIERDGRIVNKTTAPADSAYLRFTTQTIEPMHVDGLSYPCFETLDTHSALFPLNLFYGRTDARLVVNIVCDAAVVIQSALLKIVTCQPGDTLVVRRLVRTEGELLKLLGEAEPRYRAEKEALEAVKLGEEPTSPSVVVPSEKPKRLRLLFWKK